MSTIESSERLRPPTQLCDDERQTLATNLQPVSASNAFNASSNSSSPSAPTSSGTPETELTSLETTPSPKDVNCSQHQFEHDGILVGKGTFGVVSKVECMSCSLVFARKVIRIPSGRGTHREKLARLMRNELDLLMRARHPHVLRYVHHVSMPDTLQIFTEFCEGGDLYRRMEDSERLLSERFVWNVLRSLASALSWCHYGLNLEDAGEGNGLYSGFEPSWSTIIHREIKPANILLVRTCGSSPTSIDPQGASYTHDNQSDGGSDEECLVVKLGDFGTSFRLDDGDPSTFLGTQAFWSPEIQAEARENGNSITARSTQSDIWSVGVVLYRLLTGEFPSDEFQKSDTLDERILCLITSAESRYRNVPDVLMRLTCECLDPQPPGRPSALALLSVALKSDISVEGLRCSESFWTVLAAEPQDKAGVAAITTHFFVFEYLGLMDGTVFSPKEVCLLACLQSLYAPSEMPSYACRIARRLDQEFDASTVLHMAAIATTRDPYLKRLVWETTKWPNDPAFSRLSLNWNKDGLLASSVAAFNGDAELAAKFLDIEDKAQSEEIARKVNVAVANCRREATESTAKEVEFVYLLLTDNNTKTFTMKRSLAASALATAASLGYSTVVRSLVNLGFDVSARSGRREETALHFAASRADESLLSFLLEKSANVESVDTKLRAPLHCAAWSGHDTAVRLLLENGADVNARDNENRTALYGAAGGGHIAVVKMLLFWKADIHIKGGSKKESALTRAEKRAFHEVAALLRQCKGMGPDAL